MKESAEQTKLEKMLYGAWALWSVGVLTHGNPRNNE